MDDPISALDANVRKKIFKEVFQGLLRSKTRVLVTHAIDFLHLADRLVVIKDGRLTAVGTFEELQNDPHLQEVLAINKRNLEETKTRDKPAQLLDKQEIRESVVFTEVSGRDSLLIQGQLNNSSMGRSTITNSIRVT